MRNVVTFAAQLSQSPFVLVWKHPDMSHNQMLVFQNGFWSLKTPWLLQSKPQKRLSFSLSHRFMCSPILLVSIEISDEKISLKSGQKHSVLYKKNWKCSQVFKAQAVLHWSQLRKINGRTAKTFCQRDFWTINCSYDVIFHAVNKSMSCQLGSVDRSLSKPHCQS